MSQPDPERLSNTGVHTMADEGCDPDMCDSFVTDEEKDIWDNPYRRSSRKATRADHFWTIGLIAGLAVLAYLITIIPNVVWVYVFVTVMGLVLLGVAVGALVWIYQLFLDIVKSLRR